MKPWIIPCLHQLFWLLYVNHCFTFIVAFMLFKASLYLVCLPPSPYVAGITQNSCTLCNHCSHRGHKREPDPPLELKMVMILSVGAGIEPKPSMTATSTLNTERSLQLHNRHFYFFLALFSFLKFLSFFFFVKCHSIPFSFLFLFCSLLFINALRISYNVLWSNSTFPYLSFLPNFMSTPF